MAIVMNQYGGTVADTVNIFGPATFGAVAGPETVVQQQKDVDTSALSTPEAEAIWECLRVNNVVDGHNRAETVWKDAVIADEMGRFLHITNKWVVFPAYWGCSPNLRNNMTQKQVEGRDATDDIKKFRKKLKKLLQRKSAV